MARLNSWLSFPRPHVVALSASSDRESDAAPRPARILVVEDDYLVALDLEYSLLDAGFDVVGVATSAEEGLEIAASGKPDLAILDIRLAGKRDGIDLAMDLLSELGIPAIFATAHGDPQTRKRAEQASPLGWLQKPYSSEALFTLLDEALAKGTKDN